MTKKDRMKELIDLFADADQRETLNEIEMKYCPLVSEAYEVMMN